MYCGYSKHHLWIRSSGECVPCPAYDIVAGPLGQPGEYGPAQQFFNGPEMTKLRSDIENDLNPPGCHRCQSAEKIRNGGSCRTWGNEQFFQDPELPVQLTALEISAGRTCTLKCQMCSAENSTAWGAERRLRGLTTDTIDLDWTMIPVHLMKNVKYIKVTGGEPFLSPNFGKMLHELDREDLLGQMHVEIFTNLEEFPAAKFTDYLKKVKSLKIYFSLDGIGVRNEYIRSGSNWPNTVNTMLKWGQWKSNLRLDQLSFIISHTYTIFNCLNYIELADYIKGLRSNPGLQDLKLDGSHFADDDSWHNVKRLPQSIKLELEQIAADKICEFGHNMLNCPDSVWEENIDHDYKFFIGSVRASMQHQTQPLPSGSFDDWWKEVVTLDQLRGQDIRTALPDVVDLLTRHGLLDTSNPSPSVFRQSLLDLIA